MALAGKTSRIDGTPDLSHYRRHYPLTVANFGALAEREAWLRRIWDLDARWQHTLNDNGHGGGPEVIVRGAPPAGLPIEADFEIVYAGGVLGLLHAAIMACKYGRRVMVFDAHTVGKTHRDWNISGEELRDFERAGLFTQKEIEDAVVNRYRSGFVKFHDAASRVKTPALYMEGVLDVAIAADELLALASTKMRQSGTGSVLIDDQRFVRCYVQADRIVVELDDGLSGQPRLYSARLFIDATGANSPLSNQLNNAPPSVLSPEALSAAPNLTRWTSGWARSW
jgi:lycopene cyclase CruA